MYNETPWRMSGNENETNPYTMSRNGICDEDWICGHIPYLLTSLTYLYPLLISLTYNPLYYGLELSSIYIDFYFYFPIFNFFEFQSCICDGDWICGHIIAILNLIY